MALTRRVIAIAACAASLAPIAAAQQPAPPKPAAPSQGKTGGVAVVQTYKGKAVVLYVDAATRNVTVTINGQLRNYTLADSLKGIMDLKQGDTLNIETVEALGVYLKRASEPPVGTAASMMTVQPQGKPAIQGVTVKQMTGTVAQINYNMRILQIVVPPKNDSITFVADTSLHNFSRLKVGESVVLRYTQGMIVAVSK